MRGQWQGLASSVFAGLVAFCAVVTAPALSHATPQNDKSVLVLSGVIEPGAFARFKAELARRRPDVVAVDGPGGRVFEAMLIGTEIRRRGLSTIVRSNRSCASACTIVFLSGRTKALGVGAALGLHAAAYGRTADAEGTALMYDYLKRVGMPAGMASRMAAVPPDQIRWLTQREQAALGVDVSR
jgi:hypothetical protein